MLGKDKWLEQFLTQEDAVLEAEIQGGFNKPKASDRHKYGEKDPKNFGAEAAGKAEKEIDATGKESAAVRVGKPFKDASGNEHVIFKVSKTVGKAGKKTITVNVPLELDGRKLSAKAVKDLALSIADNKIDGMMKKLMASTPTNEEMIAEAKKKADAEAEMDMGADADMAADTEEKPKKKKKKEKEEPAGDDVDPEDLDLDSLDADTKVDLIERIMSSLQDNCEEKEYQKCFDKVSDMMDGFMPAEAEAEVGGGADTEEEE